MQEDRGSPAIIDEIVGRGVTRAKIGGFDIDGVLRGKYVSIDKLKSALRSGFGFCDVIFGWDIADVLYDNAKVTGWHSGYPDVHAALDPETLRYSPWEPGVATMLCDFRTGDGAEHPGCPRSLLKRVLRKAEKMGVSAKMACEFEFFVFRESPQSLHDKRYVGLQPLSPGMFGYSWVREGQHRELMADVFEQMRAFDIEIEGLHTETGPGVYEAAIRYDDALRAADKAALFKVAMKQIAHEHGVMVTFMAKWNAELPGCGGHVHQSLWRGDEPVFHGADAPDGLSRELRHYVGGQLRAMPEVFPLYAANINSYKRYVPGVWAPLTATWGIENRTASLRVIGAGTPGVRVESRQSGADLNPYLAMAAILGTGLWGIEHEIEPPAPSSGDAAGAGTDNELFLPRTLDDAVHRLRESAAAKEIFGADFVDHFSRTREWEVRQHLKAVTDWELRRYFEAV